MNTGFFKTFSTLPQQYLFNKCYAQDAKYFCAIDVMNLAIWALLCYACFKGGEADAQVALEEA